MTHTNTKLRMAAALGFAAALASAGCTREEAEISDDLKLAANVRDELQEQGLAEEVSVTAIDGVVTLFGRVPTTDDRARAETTTRDVDGVDEVRNRLDVGLPPVGTAPQDVAPPADVMPETTPPGAANPPNESE